ncbi:MAG TPA: chemotaxis protein CheW [Longimicrobiales bacterium]|nr:chemotaxis protein CheW [Longimicrobiales bacterium]
MAANDPTTGEPLASSPASQWVVFSCERHLLGVPVGQVREIVPGRRTTRIPGCGEEVAGLVNLRGGVVTVFDLGAALRLRAAAVLPEHLLLVLEREARPAALAVDHVLAVAHTPPEGLAVRQEALHALDVAAADVLGVGDWDGRAFVALDAATLMERLWG